MEDHKTGVMCRSYVHKELCGASLANHLRVVADNYSYMTSVVKPVEIYTERSRASKNIFNV